MIQNIRRSLTDLLGAEYTAAVGPPRRGPPGGAKYTHRRKPRSSARRGR